MSTALVSITNVYKRFKTIAVPFCKVKYDIRIVVLETKYCIIFEVLGNKFYETVLRQISGFYIVDNQMYFKIRTEILNVAKFMLKPMDIKVGAVRKYRSVGNP